MREPLYAKAAHRRTAVLLKSKLRDLSLEASAFSCTPTYHLRLSNVELNCLRSAQVFWLYVYTPQHTTGLLTKICNTIAMDLATPTAIQFRL
eukprot:IDg13319t1